MFKPILVTFIPSNTIKVEILLKRVLIDPNLDLVVYSEDAACHSITTNRDCQ